MALCWPFRVVDVPCVVLALAAAPARFYGCPFASSATSARSQSSRKVIPCSARGVYGVRWRLSRFFRLLLECLCGASLQFLRASSEQLLQVLSRTTCAAKEQHKAREHVTSHSRKSGSCAARTSHRLQTEEIK